MTRKCNGSASSSTATNASMTTTTTTETTNTTTTNTIATTTSTTTLTHPLHQMSFQQEPPTPPMDGMTTTPSYSLTPPFKERTIAMAVRHPHIRRRIPYHTSLSRTLVMIVLFSCTNVFQLLPLYAEKDSNPYPYGNNPNNQFKMYWNDAANVLQDLSKFSALFIKYHGCVWSECHVDQYDDDGEDRDGDEYWYQYRTQPFCANAAYSLYGTLRNAGPISSVFSRSCSRATYINSFFTYGGADTMFQALTLHSSGNSGLTTFDSMNDDETNTHPNSVCYTIEESNNNDNNDGADGLSSTMGCSADMGQFVVAQFEGTTCDGNYFLNTVEKLPSYNRIIQTVRCKQIWNYHRHYKNSIAYVNDQASGNSNGDGRRLSRQQLEKNMLHRQQIQREQIGNMTLETRRELNDNNNNNNNGQQSYTVYNSPAENLLSNSWACDISVYPKGCPDPYGLKKKYDSILQAVANGRNPRMVITNAQLKQPITVLSYLTLFLGLGLCISAYYIRNQKRMKQMGLLPMISSDLKYAFISCCSVFSDALVWCCAGCWACIIGIGRKFHKRGGKKSRKERMEEKAAKREERQRKKLQDRKHRQFSLTGSGSDTSSMRRGASGRPASAGRALSRSRKTRHSSADEEDFDILPSSSNKTGASRKSSKSHRKSSSGTKSDRKVRSKSSSRVPTSSHHSSSHYRNMEDDDDDDFHSVEEQQRYVRNSLGGGKNPVTNEPQTSKQQKPVCTNFQSHRRQIENCSIMSFLPIIQKFAFRQQQQQRYLRHASTSAASGLFHHPIDHALHNVVYHTGSATMNVTFHVSSFIPPINASITRMIPFVLANITKTAMLHPTILSPTATTLTTAITRTPSFSAVLNDLWIWCMKRTFQPSIIRKKRKTGFLVRLRTVGGRRMLARRKAKKRTRLGGGI